MLLLDSVTSLSFCCVRSISFCGLTSIKYPKLMYSYTTYRVALLLSLWDYMAGIISHVLWMHRTGEQWLRYRAALFACKTLHLGTFSNDHTRVFNLI